MKRGNSENKKLEIHTGKLNRNAPKMTTLLTFKIDQTKREEQEIKTIKKKKKKTGPAAQQKGEEFLFVFCLFSLQAQIFEWSEKKTEFKADGALLETDEVQV